MRGSRLANVLVATAAGLVFLAGLLVSGGVGAILLLAVAAFLVVLLTAAWPHIPARGRRMRVVIIAVVVLIAVIKMATR